MVALGIVTTWYVWLTRQQVHATKTSQRPYVYLDVAGEGGGLIEFAIANYGDWWVIEVDPDNGRARLTRTSLTRTRRREWRYRTNWISG
jgi:hypothetical protein